MAQFTTQERPTFKKEWMKRAAHAAEFTGKRAGALDDETLVIEMGGFGCFEVVHEVEGTGKFFGRVFGHTWGWSYRPVGEVDDIEFDRTGTSRITTKADAVAELLNYVIDVADMAGVE
jgi:hypothetical protein